MSIWGSGTKEEKETRIRELLHAAEIVIEPIERLFEPRRVGESVAGIKKDMALVRQRQAKKLEKRELATFERNHKVVSSVDHQNGNLSGK